MKVNRRQFLTVSSGLLAGAFLSACLNFSDEEPEPKPVPLDPGEVPPAGGAPLHNSSERFFLINNDDGLLAFSTRCTHQGCNVRWEDARNEFHCPCHGSTFNRHGEPTNGPAPRPLDLLAVTVEPSGKVVVTAGPTTRREEWHPDQSVPLT